MRCEDVEFRLLELIEGELPPAGRAAILAHLDGCPACAAESSAYRDLFARVQTDRVPEPSPDFWDEFLPSLKRRIEQETGTRQHTPIAWPAGIGSWFRVQPRFIAGLAVAAVSLFIVVRLPGFLPVRSDRQTVPAVAERVIGQNSVDNGAATASRPDTGNSQPREPFMVAGEIVEEPSMLVAAAQRLHGVDEIADRLETAWLLRPEADPTDSFASLDEKEQQMLLNHLSQFGWSES